MEHAETVKKLSKQEDLVSQLQQAQAAHQAAVKLAHEAKVLPSLCASIKSWHAASNILICSQCMSKDKCCKCV